MVVERVPLHAQTPPAPDVAGRPGHDRATRHHPGDTTQSTPRQRTTGEVSRNSDDASPSNPT